MGNDQSVIDESVAPVKLDDRSLSAVAKLVKDGKAKKIVVMTGAGLSTAAGIPDFRSPGTGLYANLARLNLPTAESVFELDYFRGNPNPFYVLAKELYPGKYKPTLSHVFIALLAKKGLLRLLFTQNIDCLEREAGVPGDLIVEAHGSFATQRCIDCKKEFPDDTMKQHVLSGEVPRCVDSVCNGLVKPDIVFFGEQLPAAFFRSLPALDEADLALIMGTSLTVHPFAGLPEGVANDCPRVLFNMERVGTLGTRADDVLALGDCDANVCTLADELGWLEELHELWEETVGKAEAERQLKGIQDRKDKMLGEMEELTNRIGAGLTLDDTEHSEGDDGVIDNKGRSGALSENRSASDELSDTATPLSGPRDTTVATQNIKTEFDTEQKQKMASIVREAFQKMEPEAEGSPSTAPKIKAEAEDPSASTSTSTVDAKEVQVKEESSPASEPPKENASKDSKESLNKSAL